MRRALFVCPRAPFQRRRPDWDVVCLTVPAPGSHEGVLDRPPISILRTTFTVFCFAALSLPVAANPLTGAAAALGEDPAALGIGGVDAGAYTIEFTFHDINSDKTMNVTQAFKVVK